MFQLPFFLVHLPFFLKFAAILFAAILSSSSPDRPYLLVRTDPDDSDLKKSAMSFTTINGISTERDSFIVPLLSSQRSVLNCSSQVAIVGSKVCPIESLDYEIFENEIFKQDWRTRRKLQIFEYTFMKWILCFLIGLIVSVIGFCNNLSVENIAGVKLVATSNLMLKDRYWMAFLVFLISNLVLTLFAALITILISPAAAGSGIPEVKAYLNGVDAPRIFSIKTLIVKVVGSISVGSSSLLVGKAGPMVHTGACVASLLGQGGSTKYHLTCRFLRYFRNDRDRRDLITCGAAAGIAAAFRAPVGGLLFAFEEMVSWWRSALLWRAFFTTAIVAIILRSLIDVCLSGRCGLFGTGGLIMFDVYSESVTYHLVDVPSVLALGVIGGMLGSFFNFILGKVLRLYSLVNEKGVAYKILLAAAVSIFTSCLLFGLPWLGTCKPCPTTSSEECPTIGRLGKYLKFQCSADHYNNLASLIFNTSDDAIKILFSKDSDSEFQYSSIIIFFITCYCLSIISYGVVAPIGLFIPVILTGASYGRLVGMLVGSRTKLDHGLFAVLGAVSLLGGTMRMTVSLSVIILELTNNLLLLPLIMVVSLVSKTVADAFNSNIYDQIMKAKGFPYLESHAEPYMRQLTVGDVVMGPLQIFQGIEKVSNIVNVLRRTRHHGFPVVDEPPFSDSPVLFGIVLRAHLITLLKKKAFLTTTVPIDISAYTQLSAGDFAKRGSNNTEDIEDVELTEEDMGMFVDLHLFSNASPYTVVETMSLAKALVLFRQVGLRHMLVIPKVSSRSPVVGILTRHDFMPEHILGLYPSLVKSRWKRLRIQIPQLSRCFK